MGKVKRQILHIAICFSLGMGGVSSSLGYFPDEIQTIGWIFDHVFTIHGHVVTFEAVVKEIDVNAAVPGAPCLRGTGYGITLEDSTGSIQSILCGDPGVAVGDHVIATAIISVINQYTHPPVIIAKQVHFEQASHTLP